MATTTTEPYEHGDPRIGGVDTYTWRAVPAPKEPDLAIAHDRQPYPTAWAYGQACKALEHHRQRADEAEAELARIRSEH